MNEKMYQILKQNNTEMRKFQSQENPRTFD